MLIQSMPYFHQLLKPTLYTYRKDHKNFTDKEKGPPVRPLCDVSDSYGHKLSHFLCSILKEVDDEQETICDSTEHMIAAIQKANNEYGNNKKLVIGSMDVKALYPSLDIDFTTDIVCEEFFNSEVKIENVDYAEVGLYLRLNRDEKYLKDCNIEDLCPKRIHKNGAKPKITGNGITVDKDKRWKLWNAPTREPNETEKRQMLKESLKIALEMIMKNHTYKFEDVIRKQKEGGAIGIDLTGEMARIFMCWWDRQILDKLAKIGVKVLLYKRYVDDINMVIEYMIGNYDYVARKLEKIVGPDTEDKKDQRMFEIIRKVGNEIHKSIQLTSDTPSENADGKVPILDLKCWIGEEKDGKERILHEHYMKSMSSKVLYTDKLQCR